MSSKTIRRLAVLAAAGLVLGAFVAGPADAKKKKKKKGCPTFTAPDWAADAETTIVTDAATADAPIEIELTTEPGAGFTNTDYPEDEGVTRVFNNIVVDTNAKSANLFAAAEYLPMWDYDLFLRIAAGPAVAWEADFNPATAGGPTGVGSAESGHAGPGLSQIDGYPVPDCTGHTLDLASAISGGGAVTLKLWLEQ